MAEVRTQGSAKFVPVFDNDGTLLAEMPNINIAFALDQVRRLSGQNPEWRNSQCLR
ncbi:hypothetical protein V1291_000702 [Nitrobacteraceae bacterium AZCC 1564]